MIDIIFVVDFNASHSHIRHELAVSDPVFAHLGQSDVNGVQLLLLLLVLSVIEGLLE